MNGSIFAESELKMALLKMILTSQLEVQLHSAGIELMCLTVCLSHFVPTVYSLIIQNNEGEIKHE